jgi:sugar-specific transcriptional regulator TrmB
MNEKEKRLHQCSKPVQKVIKYIENRLNHRKSRIKKEIHDLEQKLTKSLSKKTRNLYEYRIKELRKDLAKPEFTDKDTYIVLLLSKIEPDYQKRFIVCSNEEDFDYFFPSSEDPHLFYAMLEIGIDPSKYLKTFEADSLDDGRIVFNRDENSGIIKFFVQCRPSSKVTQKGLEYYLKNYKDIIENEYHDLDSVSEGLEALIMANINKYSKEITFHRDYLIKYQKDNGSIYKQDSEILTQTAKSLRALSLILEPENPVIKKGHVFLEDVLNDTKNYKNHWDSDLALAALTLIELGDGSTSHVVDTNHKLSELRRELNRVKPKFLETSPDINVQSIRDKLYEIINDAEEEIQIISPFIDMYSELAGRAKQNPSMKVTILTRPIGQFEGERRKFAKNAWETLNKLPNVTIRISDLIHARMTIVDSKKILVSSADWTHNQLYDEFNAGLYAEDIDSIDGAKKFFKNCFDISAPISKKRKLEN